MTQKIRNFETLLEKTIIYRKLSKGLVKSRIKCFKQPIRESPFFTVEPRFYKTQGSRKRFHKIEVGAFLTEQRQNFSIKLRFDFVKFSVEIHVRSISCKVQSRKSTVEPRFYEIQE